MSQIAIQKSIRLRVNDTSASDSFGGAFLLHNVLLLPSFCDKVFRTKRIIHLKTKKEKMENITVEELKSRSDAGEQLIVIDVREPHEYAEANIAAVLVPLADVLSGSFEKLQATKDDEIIFQCRSGKRSANAALFLESLGYKNCKNLVGGILEWQGKFGDAKLN
jgi:rhodanese-related sulfurtransferase